MTLCAVAVAFSIAAAAAPDTAPPPAPVSIAALPLKGVVFLSDPQQAMPEGWPALQGATLDAARVPALANPDFAAKLQPLLGRPVTSAVTDVTGLVSDYFKSIGRPFVGVMLPRQALSNGVLQVVVVEARLGTLKVEGNRWFDDGQYLDPLHVASGGTIDTRVLNADIDTVNRNPFRHAQIVAGQGTETGTTDLTIRAEERFPLSATLGADNTGNVATGRTRLSAGLEWANALWRGDDATYTYITSTDARRLQEHVGNYTIFLPWGDTLALSGSSAVSQGDSDSLLSSTGRNTAASLRYTLPLTDRPDFNQSIVLGFDFKRANNDLLFGGTSVFPTDTDVDQFVAVYSASWIGSGTTDLTASIVASPGGMTGDNNDATFTSQRGGAGARYAYARVEIDRLTPLPYRLSWFARATGQLSTDNLLPSEALAFGGYQSVRGFDEQWAVRDNGVILTNELRSPGWSFGLADGQDRLMVFAFLDIGVGHNHDDLGGPGSALTMIGIGPGVSYQVGRYVSLRLASGFVLDEHGAAGASPNRTHVGLQVNF